jgi:hypothetical protein
LQRDFSGNTGWIFPKPIPRLAYRFGFANGARLLGKREFRKPLLFLD